MMRILEGGGLVNSPLNYDINTIQHACSDIQRMYMGKNHIQDTPALDISHSPELLYPKYFNNMNTVTFYCLN